MALARSGEANEPMEPRIIPRAEHPLSRRLIDPDVLRILYRLKHEGHEAYLVGGAVRDILRGGCQPKDFDVATGATPMELRRLFRNSRIIGRRFRLVHVFFGAKNIEVATLRRYVQAADAGNLTDGDGDGDGDDLYIDDDNNWGDVESDSFRRDFTVNALFYDIRDFSLIDYTGGIDDLEARRIRAIGDPWVRFREDPVRMLRAVKFAARFGFQIEPETAAAMRELPDEITKASRFRVTEEIFRILTQANRHDGLGLLRDFGLLDAIFPTWTEIVGGGGLEQVAEFFDAVEAEAKEDRFLPLEVAAAGLFLPMLDTVDIDADSFHDHASRMSEEVRRIGLEMDLPRRLLSAVVTLLKGQLYLLYFADRPKSIRRYVMSREFDWVWRLHDLAFGRVTALHGVQERWLHAREQLPTPVGGWADEPDRRDIFSFRGASGGGRRPAEEPATIFTPQHHDHGEASPRRRRRRRR